MQPVPGLLALPGSITSYMRGPFRGFDLERVSVGRDGIQIPHMSYYSLFSLGSIISYHPFSKLCQEYAKCNSGYLWKTHVKTSRALSRYKHAMLNELQALQSSIDMLKALMWDTTLQNDVGHGLGTDYLCLSLSLSIYIYMYTYIHIHICANGYICVYVYVYTYIYRHYRHVQTHMYTSRYFVMRSPTTIAMPLPAGHWRRLWRFATSRSAGSLLPMFHEHTCIYIYIYIYMHM